ncbi:GntR family transcriptional regulator [uncultured Ilyobacter sp.]|uniref:GntR family transcriptional regulator n=1 Tax=uncultured Ilyobacter sp. TaxID=544433 RepID=UPI002AA7160A|nr:GntR family transcriptional regulator [uncultured Ilyobacter sp.]
MIEKQLAYKYKLYEKIKEDIITGVYSQGEVLNERKLSKTMGISRTPVREALQLLSHDGWVVNEIYKGTVVRTFEEGYVLNTLKVRTALELLAIEDAILYMNNQGIEEIDEIIYRQEKSLIDYNPTEFMKLDREFHDKIYSFSKNNVLIDLLKNFNDIIRYFGIQALTIPERNLHTLKEHKNIVSEMKNKNIEEAKKTMETHMLMTGNAIFEYSGKK